MGKEEATVIADMILGEDASIERVLEVINSCVTPEQLVSATNYAKLFMDRVVQEQFQQFRDINIALQYKREDLGITLAEDHAHV